MGGGDYPPGDRRTSIAGGAPSPVESQGAYGFASTSVGCVDGSHTSLLVATSSFMFVQVRRPGIVFCPSSTARAYAIMRSCVRSFSTSGHVSYGCGPRTTTRSFNPFTRLYDST